MSFGYEVSEALDIIRREREIYKDYISNDTISAGCKIVSAVDGLYKDVKDSIIQLVKREVRFQYPYVSVWWYSVLTALKKDPAVFYEFVSYVRKNLKCFSPNTQYFLFYQLKSLRFRFSELDTLDTGVELWHLFEEIVEEFAGRMDVSLEAIPREGRDFHKALVITEQFLSIQHGPTKTALDRCKILMTTMHKEVMLINTAEVLSLEGIIPFFGTHSGNYMESALEDAYQSWKGVDIPFMQCENNMPDIKTIELLLRQIRDMAPGYVVAIGGNGIVANLVNKMIPVLTVGLSPSALEATTTKYQLLGRKLNDMDKALLQKAGIPEHSVIESVFTSSLKPQSEHVSRKELGIPEKAFVLAVVGARLDYEVTPEFLEMLEDVTADGMYVVFFGIFSNYENRLKKYPRLYAHASYLGFTEDILSKMEVCDLYVNPNRSGGGTSCVEAMYMGVPVVTLNYGDVSVNAGEGFCVDTYSDMEEKILEYKDDREYYKKMSEKAKERTEVLLDTEKEFVRIIQEMDKRESGF